MKTEVKSQSSQSTPKIAALALVLCAVCLLPSALRAQQAQAQSGQPIYPVNAKYVQGVGPGYWPTMGNGLTLNLAAGTAVCSNTVETYAGGTLTLTASVTNYVYLDSTSSCAPTANTSGFSSITIPIAVVICGSLACSTPVDARTMFTYGMSGGSGGGGGSPGGSTGQIQYNNSGILGGGNLTGDCTTSTLAITCTQVNGSNFTVSSGGNATAAGTVKAAAMQVTGVTNAGLLATDGSGNIEAANDPNMNIYNVGGNATATAGSGIQKVGIVGNAAGVVDAAQGGSAPANLLTVGCVFNSSYSALTSGQVGMFNCDSTGHLNVNANISNSSVAVTGTFWQSTQPVSLSSLPALASGSNTIGAVTQASGPWTMNLTQMDGAALGAPSNYGTSPGAVAVQGVNAYVTNTVPVSGTFWQPTQPVSGTFWQATQPVSFTKQSIDLFGNTGVALDAAQGGSLPANEFLVGCGYISSYSTLSSGQIGYFNCDSTGHLNVNIANTPNVNVQSNASVNVNQWAGTALGALSNYGTSPGAVAVPGVNAYITNTVPVTGSFSLTFPYSGTSNGQTATSASFLGAGGLYNSSLPTLTNTQFSPFQVDSGGRLIVSCGSGCGGSGGTSLADEGTFTQGTTSFTPLGGYYNTSITNLTTGQGGAAQMTNTRHLMVNVADALPAGSNTIGAVTQASGPWTMNLTQMDGSALGAPSNYGTSPGAVAVQGVNAYVTNTVPVSGTFWQTTQPVSGTFWQTTQPVSFTKQSIDLFGNTGVALDAAQGGSLPANEFLVGCGYISSYSTLSSGQIGYFNCDSTGHLNVNIANTPNVNVQSNASVNVNQWAGTALGALSNYGTSPGAVAVPGVNAYITNTVPVTGSFSLTFPYSGTSNGQTATSASFLGAGGLYNSSLPTLTNTQFSPFQVDSSGRLIVSCGSGCGGSGGTSLADEGTFTQGTTSFTPLGGYYNTSITNLTTGQGGAAQMTNTRHLMVNVADALPAGSNTIGAVTQASGPWTMNLTQMDGSALGAPSNYGTSPGAVAVQGVNAYVTNTVPVSGTFWQTTQPVSGTFWQTTQPVSGTFWQTTQPVSISGDQAVNTAQVNGVTVLTGTGATGTGAQRVTVSEDTNTIAGSAVGTAGTPSANVISIQGVSSGTNLPVSQATASSLNATIVGSLSNNGAAATSNFVAALAGIAQTTPNNGTAATQGRNVAPNVGTDGALWVNAQPALRPASYEASANFAASSTTDNACIYGNSTDTAVLYEVYVSGVQTTAGIVNVALNRHSAAESGGTSSNMTAVRGDVTNYAAASTTPVYYTGTGPTAGASVGSVDNKYTAFLSTSTATPADLYLWDGRLKPQVLIGTSQGVCVNLGGALTGGNLSLTFRWLEISNISE